MIDISSVLESICGTGDKWVSGAAGAVAGDLARSIGADIDWDGDAGEEWLSLLVEDARVAIVSAELPLIVTLECHSFDSSAVSRGARIVAVSSFETPELCCDSAVLRRTFGEMQAYGTLNPDSFSGNDLWFATV
ncbi:hypothetical protein [Streptomyces sp. WM6368]|uniref:hypothetical protein n=1 Tax=Streptomyces sp. WM6368 TaxID=1415554 RepID=UPI00131A650F|nr:hypothetical protein [Streptomyces sp. WM6368]